MCLIKKTWLLQIFLISCAYFLNCFALNEDSQQPMHIEANSTVIDYKNGKNIYEGNVKVDQGTTHVVADRLITINNDKHKIKEAIAYGLNNLAEFITLPNPKDKVFTAKSKIIKFYPIDSKVILEGSVSVIQGQNSFRGPIIIYNMKDQIVNVPASKGGRAMIVIETKKSA